MQSRCEAKREEVGRTFQRMFPSLCVALLAFSGCIHLPANLTSITFGRHPEEQTPLIMARLHERQGHFVKARNLYAEIVRTRPYDANASHRLAVVQTKLGMNDQANHFYHRSLQLDPDNSDVLTDYGYFLFLNNNLGSAEQTLRKAVTLDPSNKRSVNNLALVLGHQGHLKESLALFRRVNSEAEARANVAYIHAQRGETELAIEQYSQALTLDRHLKTAANALVQMAALKKQAIATIDLHPSQQWNATEQPTETNHAESAHHSSTVLVVAKATTTNDSNTKVVLTPSLASEVSKPSRLTVDNSFQEPERRPSGRKVIVPKQSDEVELAQFDAPVWKKTNADGRTSDESPDTLSSHNIGPAVEHAVPVQGNVTKPNPANKQDAAGSRRDAINSSPFGLSMLFEVDRTTRMMGRR